MDTKLRLSMLRDRSRWESRMLWKRWRRHWVGIEWCHAPFVSDQWWRRRRIQVRRVGVHEVGSKVEKMVLHEWYEWMDWSRWRLLMLLLLLKQMKLHDDDVLETWTSAYGMTWFLQQNKWHDLPLKTEVLCYLMQIAKESNPLST
jgi:hypothetical protein